MSFGYSHASELAGSATSDLGDPELEELSLELLKLAGQVSLGLAGEFVSLDLCHDDEGVGDETMWEGES